MAVRGDLTYASGQGLVAEGASATSAAAPSSIRASTVEIVRSALEIALKCALEALSPSPA
jgi:hypothetical protein